MSKLFFRLSNCAWSGFLNVSIKKSIAALLFLFSSTAFSQIIENKISQVWINQDTNTVKVDTALSYVGNHPVLDKESVTVLQKLEEIAQETHGTLFIVVSPKVDSLSPDLQLKIGNVSLYKDHASIDGVDIGIPAIKEKPAIVKIRYQGKPKPYYRKGKVYINSEIDIAEVIYYKNKLNDEDCRIVESLLAMKYSINITENTDPEKRDYIHIYDAKAWDYGADASYNEEVLALGHIGKVQFHQSQTFTSKDELIRASLEETGIPGDTPRTTMGDSSLLMMSKRTTYGSSFQDARGCAGNLKEHPWKFRFFDWHSSAPYIYLRLDTIIDSTRLITFTDGDTTWPVDHYTDSLYSTFKIPIPKNIDKPYYYVEIAPDTTCPQKVMVDRMACDSTKRWNELTITTDEWALPIELQLRNLTTGENMIVSIDSTYAQITGLNAGQYQLYVYNEDGSLLDEIFSFENCSESNESENYISDRDSITDGGGIDINGVNGGDANSTGENDISNWILIQGEGAIAGGGIYGGDSTDTHHGNDPYGDDWWESLLEGGNGADKPKGITPYPNPGRQGEITYFEFNKLNDQPFHILIYDTKGNIMEDTSFLPQIGNATYQYIFTEDGSYFIRFSTQGYTITKSVRIKSNI